MCLESRIEKDGVVDATMKENFNYEIFWNWYGLKQWKEELTTHPQPYPSFCEEEKYQRELSQNHTFVWKFGLHSVDPNPDKKLKNRLISINKKVHPDVSQKLRINI